MLYQGRVGLRWWTGVVEDRNDPLFLNRVRVRIYGAHSYQKDLIATPDLPWSQVMMPTTSPSLSGLGTTTHGLVEGSTVMGFYRDAEFEQDPVVMGSFIGAPKDFSRIDEIVDENRNRNFTQISRKPSEGFNDPRLATAEDYERPTGFVGTLGPDDSSSPDGKSPKHINRNYGLTLALDKSPRVMGKSTGESYPKESYIVDGSSDVNKLALGDSTFYPVVAEVKGEPARSNYVKPTYPFNHVHETESGHVIELDDTPDAERLHAYHRTGTRVEIDKDGTYVEKIVKDKYTLIINNDTVKIAGTVDVEVGESLAANAIAAGGGTTKVALAANKELIEGDANSISFTAATKAKLKQVGVTEEEIEAVEKEGKFKDQLQTSTEEALDAFDDIKNNATLSTIVDTVEGVNQGADGITSVIDQVSEYIGGEGLSTEASTIITDVLSGGDAADIVVSKGIELVKEKLTDKLDTAVVDQIEGKLEELLAGNSVESMKAVVSEKVSSVVTDAFGEKAGEVISGQMANAVSSVATGALMGAFGSPRVNISVSGTTKIHSTGATNIISDGSTNVTSGTGINITTLAQNTSIKTLMGNTDITNAVGNIDVRALAGNITVDSPVGVLTANCMKARVTAFDTAHVQAVKSLNLRSAIINSQGVWNHTGAMNIKGLTTITGDTTISGFTEIAGLATVGGTLVVAGAVTASTSLVSPLITGAAHTHTHVIAGSPANALITATGIG